MGLKKLGIRIRLPWKENPREANRLYKQIYRSNDPEATIRELKKSFKI